MRFFLLLPIMLMCSAESFAGELKELFDSKSSQEEMQVREEINHWLDRNLKSGLRDGVLIKQKEVNLVQDELTGNFLVTTYFRTTNKKRKKYVCKNETEVEVIIDNRFSASQRRFRVHGLRRINPEDILCRSLSRN